MTKLRIAVLLAVLLLPLSLLAQDVPVLASRVNDYASLLDNRQSAEIEQALKAFEDSTTTQVVVLTIPTLDGQNLDTYANTVFNTWGLGQQEANNGVLLLIVSGERKMRIEVGYGLEGDLTDAEAGRIIRNVIAPNFKKGNFHKGIERGTNAIMLEVSGRSIPETRDHTEIPDDLVLFLFVAGALMLLVVGLLVGNRVWRYRPRVSKKTGQKMERLDEKADDAHLTAGQRMEEMLGSVDYDVWVTLDGSDRQIKAYKRWWKSISNCSKCDYRTFRTTKTSVIKYATYSSSGLKRVTKQCAHCDHQQVSNVTIPRKQRSSSGSFSSGSGGFSGGGGGGFSGGGGSSGGGGASGGW